MPSLLVGTSSLTLTPDAGWSLVGWDGVVKLEQGLTGVSAGGQEVVLETHLMAAIAKAGAGRAYKSTLFSDVPGMVATLVAEVDGGTLAQTVEAGKSRVALATVTGKFSAIVGAPSLKATPGGPIPDSVLVKTGTWKVDHSAQDTVSGS